LVRNVSIIFKKNQTFSTVGEILAWNNSYMIPLRSVKISWDV
jgi:hypothetical protein